MKRLLYLSGAPRVSTRDDAEAAGARAHIVGTIKGFETNGYHVDKYIVGDMYSQRLSNWGSTKKVGKNLLMRIAADVIRLYSNFKNRKIAFEKNSDKIDVVYERFCAFQNLGLPFQKKGIPWILESNSPLFYEASKERKSIFFTNICRKIELDAYKQCDYLICVTEELKNIIKNEVNIPEEKIIISPNGVDTDVFDPAKAQPKRFSNKTTIGFVGVLAPWCGVDILLQAVKLLKHARTDFHVVIVGDGWLYEEWQQLAETLQIADMVTFTGKAKWSDIPSHIAGFDITYSGQVNLQMGKMYHSPLKIYEYMSMGKPVVASAFEDAKAIIKDKTNGLLFEPGNVNDLVEKLTYAIDNVETFQQNAAQIRNELVENHSWKQRIGNIIAKISA